jgi:hypothetical protein
MNMPNVHVPTFVSVLVVVAIILGVYHLAHKH